MDIFFTADCHFDHKNIMRHANRPFASIEENDETLIHNWNEIVPRNGKVVILGDFAWRNHARFLQRLNGSKIIILGSHDKMSQDTLRLFSEVHKHSAMIHAGNNNPFFCSHCCQRVWERSHYGIPHLFGHSHGRLKTFNMSVDVGVDSDEVSKKYYPIPIEEINIWMSFREEGMKAVGRVVKDGVGGKLLFRQDDVSWLIKKHKENKENEDVNSIETV